MNESVRNYLTELSSTPFVAIEKLIGGYSGVVAWSKSNLHDVFIEIAQTHSYTLDLAITEWLKKSLMNSPPKGTPLNVWASNLQDLFSAMTGLPLPNATRLLQERQDDFCTWLHPLAIDEIINPESAYFAVLNS